MNKIESFLQTYDHILRSEDIVEAITFLQEGLQNASLEGNAENCLTILNEMIGLYRSLGEFDTCVICMDQAKELANEMGLKNHPAYATTLINCGTAYRMMDDIDESYKCFKEAEGIIEKEGSDYLKASFHNNISSVLLKFNDYKAAEEHLVMALDLLQTMKGQEIEIAVTYANLGSAYLCQHRLLEAKESLEISEKLFMKYDPSNPHYAAVYSSFAQLAYEEDRLEEAIQYYDQALVLIKKNYGYNSDYHTVEYNKDKVEDLLNRRKHYFTTNLSGLALAEKYYETYGQSLLKDYPIDYAIGLCGEGSECLGFDDEYSTDHDFGPAFCIWLKKEDYIRYGKELQDKYDQLPNHFLNYPKRNTTQEGNYRFGVLCYEDWIYRYLGMNHLPETNEEWLSIKEAGLLNLTNGKLFADSGFMSEMRSYLAYYPDKVLLKLITDEVGRVAQSGQYNYPRALKRKDTKMAYMCLNEFIQSVIHLGYLLNKQYMPYYKWAMKGMESFTVLPDLSFKIEQLLTDEEKIPMIEAICKDIQMELNKQEYTNTPVTYLEFHHRELLKRQTHE